MKFPRNARIFRGRLDVAPFAAVFFLLATFLLLGSLVYTPGVRLELPEADDLPGTDKPVPKGRAKIAISRAVAAETARLVNVEDFTRRSV